jgi:deazaflavin-dependent oxidoreductase (nitroreductase family)
MTTSTTPTEQQALGQQAHAEELDPVFLLADTDPDAMNAMNQQLIAGFRATGGQLDGAFQCVPLLLLTTTGVRSGRPRTTPVNYTTTDRGWVVVASKSGSARHPDWYHNLLANPTATIEVPGATVTVHAQITHGAERQQLFDQHAAELPNFAAYQRRTTRQLPVIVLEENP